MTLTLTQVKAMGKRPADYLKELPKLHQVRFEVLDSPTTSQ